MRNDDSRIPVNRATHASAVSGVDARARDLATALMPLSAMDNYEIADGEPDIRGWDVRSTDGEKLGEVEDLLVDPQQLMVRYIEVQLENGLAVDDMHQFAVLPIGSARLDEDDDTVFVQVTGTDFRGMPPYPRGNLTREHEDTLIRRLDAASEGARATQRAEDVDFYGQPYFDERPTFAARRARSGRTMSDDTPYLRRSEGRRT